MHWNEESMNWIDSFVSQSRGNVNVTEVYLHPYEFGDQDDEFWDKVGQALGNLQSLETIHIYNTYCDEETPLPDCEMLVRILSHVRQRITLIVTPVYYGNGDGADDSPWSVEESRSLAQAFHGHLTITRFEGGEDFPYESLDALYLALSSLPALESIRLGTPEVRQADETNLANPESLTKLLQRPTLRCVSFDRFSFTPALYQATANAFMEGTAITTLMFTECSFSGEESATMMATGLSRNTSVSDITVVSPLDQALFGVLVTALRSNSTLRSLQLWEDGNDAPNLKPLILALGENRGLKSLSLDVHGLIDEPLCTAIQDGLGMNTTLEYLKLNHVHVTDDNADLLCRAFSFLRTNKALKSLMVKVDDHLTESRAAACRTAIAAMLQENASLEIIFIQGWSNAIQLEEYVMLVTVLLYSTTLKTLCLRYPRSLRLTDDEDKNMAALLKKNYTLEKLPDIHQENGPGDVGAILRLNESGRRYLIEDGSSISKGVEVLSAVSNEINCVFFHLLENPALCDRIAVEAAASDTTGIDSNRGSTSRVNSIIGKREHGRAQNEGKESRRRLTGSTGLTFSLDSLV
jgi:hypothetical protein